MLEFNAHPLEDYTDDELLEAGRRAKNKYLRDYRRKHPEKFREYRLRAQRRAGARLLAAQAAAASVAADPDQDDSEEA